MLRLVLFELIQGNLEQHTPVLVSTSDNCTWTAHKLIQVSLIVVDSSSLHDATEEPHGHSWGHLEPVHHCSGFYIVPGISWQLNGHHCCLLFLGWL